MTMLVAFAWLGGIVVGGVFGALLMALCVTAHGEGDGLSSRDASRQESVTHTGVLRAFEDMPK